MKLSVVALLIAAFVSNTSSAQSHGRDIVSPFQAPGSWYKAALHVHTNVSDGDVNLVTRVSQYKAAGFDVVAITDHHKTNDISVWKDPSVLVISGMETHPASGKHVANHFVCLNLPVGFAFPRDANVATTIKMLKDVGGEFFYAHPYWSGHTINELLSVDGYIAMEVCNSATEKHEGNGINSVHWDQYLNTGSMIPALAVDDVHSSSDVGLAWTMIKARSLDVNSIMDSLRQGAFYASAGPVIEDFRVEGRIAKIKCSPVKNIIFHSDFYYGKRLWSENNDPLVFGTYKMPKDASWVRVEIIDDQGRRAWANPIWVGTSEK